MADAHESILPGRTSLLGKPGYAYSTLSEVEQRAYLRLVDAIAERKKIRLADYPELEAKDVSRLLACIDMDHPELFWMDCYQNRWAMIKANRKLLSEEGQADEVLDAFWKGVDYDGDGRISLLERRIAGGRAALQENPVLAWSIDNELKPSPLWFGWRIDKIQKQLDDYVEECARTISADADDYLVFRRTFEFVARHTTYDLGNAQKAQDIRSAMIDRRSVCKGYAETFQYLLLCFGIPCFTVQGIAGANESTSGPHAWSYVLIDGMWNRVDVTWGDWDLDTKPERVSYVPESIRSIFVDYSRMCVPEDCYHPFPVVAYPETGTTSDYFIREGFEISKEHAVDYACMLIRLFKKDEPYVIVRFPHDSAVDLDFVRRGMRAIKKLCLGANLDESTLRSDLAGCVERAKAITLAEFEASEIYGLGLQIMPLPGRPNTRLIMATEFQGESDKE